MSKKFENKYCEYCHKDFLGNKARIYCSRICSNRATVTERSKKQIGKKSWNEGLSKETDTRVAKQNRGNNGHAWNYKLKKGLDSKMSNFGKKTVLLEKKCEACGKAMFLKSYEFKKRRYCQISCRPSWNKGLTKEIDERLNSQSIKKKQMYLEGTLDMKKLWEGQKRKPTKPEIILGVLLNKFYRGIWRYVGDGRIWMTSNHKKLNPDFIHNFKKKVIEYNGYYTHTNEEADKRVKMYKNIGYDCLIINPDRRG